MNFRFIVTNGLRDKRNSDIKFVILVMKLIGNGWKYPLV